MQDVNIGVYMLWWLAGYEHNTQKQAIKTHLMGEILATKENSKLNGTNGDSHKVQEPECIYLAQTPFSNS